VTARFLQLGLLFVWTVAKMLVREAAWLTVQAAKQRHQARIAYAEAPRRIRHRVVDVQPVGGTWSIDQCSFDGPAGFRRSSNRQGS